MSDDFPSEIFAIRLDPADGFATFDGACDPAFDSDALELERLFADFRSNVAGE